MNSSETRSMLAQLATFASETSFDDIPPEVIERAIWVLRDTVGVILGGFDAPEVRNLAQFASDNFPGKAKLFGSAQSVRPEWVSLVYGTAGTTLEFDEGHAFARGHAAIHAVATGLALASSNDISGKDLLTAIIIGYEAAARIGVASKLHPAVHPFGAWGVVGVSAISAKLANVSAEEMLEIFELASSYAITPSYATALQGANVRNTFAGMVNHNGLLAVEIFRLGFRGEQGAITTVFGEILGQDFDVDAITDGLGEHFEMMRGYFKPYSSCRYSHATIDALLDIHEQVDVEAVSRIEVATYDFASKLNDAHPQTPLAARFSIPYIVASTLYDGDASASSFTEEAIQRTAVLELARKVKVRETKDYTAMLPHKRSAKVIIHCGATRLESESIGSKGDPDRAMTDSEVYNKFMTLTHRLTTNQQVQLWEQLGNITQLKSTNVLFDSSDEYDLFSSR